MKTDISSRNPFTLAAKTGNRETYRWGLKIPIILMLIPIFDLWIWSACFCGPGSRTKMLHIEWIRIHWSSFSTMQWHNVQCKFLPIIVIFRNFFFFQILILIQCLRSILFLIQIRAKTLTRKRESRPRSWIKNCWFPS